MVASLRSQGRMGVVLPHGTLFRSGAEGKIRKKLLEKDLVEGIVGLPAALFYNTGIPASVWIINRDKAPEQKNKVVVIDASGDYKEGKNQNELMPEHLDKIVSAYQGCADLDKYMRVVEMKEIQGNDYNLNISRYIDTSEPEPEIDLGAVRSRIRDLQASEAEIDVRLEAFLQELGV
jgi:type I restriction enzyme M protein